MTLYNWPVEVSIIIPNFNGRDRILPCIEAAQRAAKQFGKECELIVPDDASTDSSVSLIQKQFPDVKLIQGKTNLGFSSNFNRGLAEAKGKYVLALNSDVLVNPNLISVLIENFINKKDLFSVQPSICDTKGHVTDSAKTLEIPSFLFLSGFRTTGNIYKGEIEKIPHVFSSGACVLFDGQKLKSLGGFDELFSPYYNEDVDLGLRAWRRGWQSLFDPRARCLHEGSATIGKFVKSKVRVISKSNRFLLHFRHLEALDLVPFVFLKILQSLLLFPLSPRFVWGVWLRTLPRLKLLNRKFQGPISLRKVYEELRLIQNNA